MGRFDAYNTSDGSSTPLLANGTTTLGPFQADVALTIAGSIFADQAGTLYVEQSFDGGAHFDISQSFTVVANTAQSFNVSILAPILQVRYVNGSTNQTVMRLFARTFYQGR